MPTIVKVAVHVDRATAILASRNRWGWVPTELDLEFLTGTERGALALCPERKGVIYITHIPRAVEYISPAEEADSLSWTAKRVRNHFDLEWDGATKRTEATPETALAALRHLASAPHRRLQAAQQRKNELESLASEHAAAADEAARKAIADLDIWLATSPQDLVMEAANELDSGRRFERVQAPHGLQFSIRDAVVAAVTIKRDDFEMEWNRVLRTIATEGADEPEEDGWFFDPLPDLRPDVPATIAIPPAPSLLGSAESNLERARADRAKAIENQWSAISQAYLQKCAAFEQAQWEKLQRKEEERRAAVRARAEAITSGRKAASRDDVVAWARKHGHHLVVEKVETGAPDDEIAAVLRAAVFDALEPEFQRFRKITKTDILIANPGFREDARALEALFDENETELGPGREAKLFGRLAERLIAAEIPAQFRIRRHRAVLKRRDATVGVPVQACSVLVQVILGGFEVSRAFALGSLTTVEG